MKATEKQKRVIEFFRTQLNYWENTNDINSPTHEGDIREELNKLDDVLNDEEIATIDICAHQMYLNIKELE